MILENILIIFLYILKCELGLKIGKMKRVKNIIQSCRIIIIRGGEVKIDFA